MKLILLIAVAVFLPMGTSSQPLLTNNRKRVSYIPDILDTNSKNFAPEALGSYAYHRSPRYLEEVYLPYGYGSYELFPNSAAESFKRTTDLHHSSFDNKGPHLVRRRQLLDRVKNGYRSSVSGKKSKRGQESTKIGSDVRPDRGATLEIDAHMPGHRVKDKIWEDHMLPGLVKQVINELKNEEAASEVPFDDVLTEMQSVEGVEGIAGNPMIPPRPVVPRPIYFHKDAPLKVSVNSAFPCDQWEEKKRTCWFDRNIGDTITFVLATDTLGESHAVRVEWKQEFYNRKTNSTISVDVTPDKSMWNVVVGSGGREFRISPITEPDVDYNRFTATVTAMRSEIHGHDHFASKVTFRIRPVPIDLGFVYTGESLMLNIESFVSLPLESMMYHWYMEKYGERSSLPSNMKMSPKGSSVAISELRKDQEGIITCSVYTNRDIFMTKKRFLIKELNRDTLMDVRSRTHGHQTRQLTEPSKKIRVKRHAEYLTISKEELADAVGPGGEYKEGFDADLIASGIPLQLTNTHLANIKSGRFNNQIRQSNKIRVKRQVEEINSEVLDAAVGAGGEQKDGFEVDIMTPKIPLQATTLPLNQNINTNPVHQRTNSNLLRNSSGSFDSVQSNLDGKIFIAPGFQLNSNTTGNGQSLIPNIILEKNVNPSLGNPIQNIEHNANSKSFVLSNVGQSNSYMPKQVQPALYNPLPNDRIMSNMNTYNQYRAPNPNSIQLNAVEQSPVQSNFNQLINNQNPGVDLLLNQKTQKEHVQKSASTGGNENLILNQISQNSVPGKVLKIERPVEDPENKFEDRVSKMIADCVIDRQCSGHATCIINAPSIPGFCKCLRGFHGNGIFCWEDSVYARNVDSNSEKNGAETYFDDTQANIKSVENEPMINIEEAQPENKDGEVPEMTKEI